MRWSFATVLILAGCQCATPSALDAGGDAAACEGPTPLCLTLYGTCCEDTGFQASCAHGAWTCDPCALGDWACGRPAILSGDCRRTTRDAARAGMSVPDYCGPRDE